MKCILMWLYFYLIILSEFKELYDGKFSRVGCNLYLKIKALNRFSPKSGMYELYSDSGLGSPKLDFRVNRCPSQYLPAKLCYIHLGNKIQVGGLIGLHAAS